MRISGRIIIISTLILALTGIALAAQMMSVQVRSGQLREKPSYLGRDVTTLPYGDRVTLIAEEGEWRKVTSIKKGKTGWMHISALTQLEVILRPTNRHIEAAAQSGELALAGKGFNKQVEENFKNQKKLDYTLVDEMDAYSVNQEEIRAFVKSGSLAKGGSR